MNLRCRLGDEQLKLCKPRAALELGGDALAEESGARLGTLGTAIGTTMPATLAEVRPVGSGYYTMTLESGVATSKLC